MKTHHVVIMILATVSTIYIGAGVAAKSRGVSGTVGRLVSEERAGMEVEGENLSELLDDLRSVRANDEMTEETVTGRDPMVPKEKKRSAPRSEPTTPPRPSRSGVVVTALVIDSSPMAIVETGGRSISVRVGDTVNGGKVTEITSDGVVVDYDGTTRTYSYPAGK